MKACKHHNQTVSCLDDGVKTQVCTNCQVVVAKWNEKSGFILFELPTKKKGILPLDYQVFS